MTAWWLCAAGVRLRAQINLRWPNRDHSSDGAIGDTAHMSKFSGHNPATADNWARQRCEFPPSDPPGAVRAIDIDEDFTCIDDERANKFLAQLIKLDDPRVAYAIFEGIKYVRTRHWIGEVYRGRNPHAHHIHISFTPAGDHDGTPFALPILEVPTCSASTTSP